MYKNEINTRRNSKSPEEVYNKDSNSNTGQKKATMHQVTVMLSTSKM